MRRAALVTALVLAVGAAAFGGDLFVKRTTLAFPLGGTTSTIAAVLKPGSVACQGPITTPSYGAFDRIVLQLGTYGARGPAVDVTVRDARHHVLAASRLAGGYPDVGAAPHHTIRFGRMLRGQRLQVCLRNRGTSRLAIYGSGDNAVRESHASVDGRLNGHDLNIEFRRPGRTYASLAGSIVKRAGLWRTPHPPGWFYATLLVLLAAVAAAGVVVAVARAAVDEESSD